MADIQFMIKQLSFTAVAAVSSLIFPCLGAPGDLDPSFGRGGAILTDSLNFGARRVMYGYQGHPSDILTFANDAANAITLQLDGKIIVAGSSETWTGGGVNGEPIQSTRTYPVYVVRYLTDGTARCFVWNSGRR